MCKSNNVIKSHLKTRRWKDYAWRLYYHLPAPVDDILKRRFPYILLFKSLRIPITILRGSTRPDGHPGTVIAAGTLDSLDYLTSTFFEGDIMRESLGLFPLWKLPRFLRLLRTSADLTFIHIDRFSARLFFGADYLAVQEWVGSTLVVPMDLKERARSSHSLTEDLRIVRRNNLLPEITHLEEDFEVFYHTMYVPFTLKRHGKQAVVHDFYRIRRIFRLGGLLWVMQNGQPIAGVIYQRKNQILRFITLGTMNGEYSHVKAGAIAALYLFSIELAKKIGCKLIDFGGCRPSLNDGLLLYKKKWGMNITVSSDDYYDFLIHWNYLNESVTNFLTNTNLIFRDQQGLSAISVIDKDQGETQTNLRKIHKSIWISGLRRLYLVDASSGFRVEKDIPQNTSLIRISDFDNFDFQTIQTIGNNKIT